jgi:4-amino-4-deoxy-L-arabinose transferase-like glycosyltransferase
LLHVVVRTIISGSVEFDEAEQILFSQNFSLGYVTQGPLYEWFQRIVFAIFGLNVFSLALFKNFLFIISYLFIYKSARLILESDIYAALSSGALLLTHTYSWQSMRQLTHSILVVAIAAVTFYLFLKILIKKETKLYPVRSLASNGVYLALGVFVGLGILAKYNYLIFIVALFLAALSIKDFRKSLINKRLLWALVIICLMVLPHVFWVFQNFSQTTLRLKEIQIDAAERNNFFGLGFRVLATLIQFSFVLLIFFPQALKKNSAYTGQDKQLKTLLGRFFLISLIIVASLIVGFKIIDFEERWLQPIFFIFPMYFFLLIKNRNISGRRVKFFIGAILFSAFMNLIMILVCTVFPDTFGHKRIHYPGEKLAKVIKDETGFSQGLILSPETSLAADLKLNFKDSFVETPQMSPKARKGHSQILLIWNSQWDHKVPPRMYGLLAKYKIDINQANLKVKGAKALYKYAKEESYPIGFVFLDQTKSKP